jgi:hypothetical protein
MASQLTDECRRTSYEISQAIAPGWERWRSQLEAAVAPVRDQETTDAIKVAFDLSN